MPFRAFVSRRYLLTERHWPSPVPSCRTAASILPMQFAPTATAATHEIVKGCRRRRHQGFGRLGWSTAMRTKILLVLAALSLASPMARADQLIYITEPAGEKLFDEADEKSAYFKLATYLETEQILTFCGPATIAAVLNSLEIKRPSPPRLYPWGLFTQDLVFTPENQKIKSYAMVEEDGLVLEQINAFLINLGVKAEFHHADTIDVSKLRQLIKDTLADPNKRLIVNYTRQAIGQNGAGHVSPIGAYDAETDRALVLDVAKYKYPPVWMTLADLYKAINTIDSGSNKTRGIVVVTK
ncbi:phytochelatin synthase family protein [Mesorhizobium intechi]|uniref:phytochelatin synthase family protein n=1 Tax=Mesorhizobium intechi TaxID=537601 RepID=UPI001ABFC394|nr:phytochelatin synthase family protein [Mesorhizobium intechi]